MSLYVRHQFCAFFSELDVYVSFNNYKSASMFHCRKQKQKHKNVVIFSNVLLHFQPKFINNSSKFDVSIQIVLTMVISTNLI